MLNMIKRALEKVNICNVLTLHVSIDAFINLGYWINCFEKFGKFRFKFSLVFGHFNAQPHNGWSKMFLVLFIFNNLPFLFFEENSKILRYAFYLICYIFWIKCEFCIVFFTGLLTNLALICFFNLWVNKQDLFV